MQTLDAATDTGPAPAPCKDTVEAGAHAAEKVATATVKRAHLIFYSRYHVCGGKNFSFSKRLGAVVILFLFNLLPTRTLLLPTAAVPIVLLPKARTNSLKGMRVEIYPYKLES